MNRLLLLFCLLYATLAAQDYDRLALDHLRQNGEKLALAPSATDEMRVTDSYASPDGTHHVYVHQVLNGYPIQGAVGMVHFHQREVINSSTRFLPELATHKQRSVTPVLTASTAYRMAATYLTTDGGFVPTTAARSNRLLYYPVGRGQDLRLAYEFLIDVHGTSDLWAILIDAGDGRELYRQNLTLYCNFSEEPGHVHSSEEYRPAPAAAATTDGASYLVFPFGVESPLHGGRRLEVDPADTLYSPLGWHDRDGFPGAEFTTTRGNNVFAYLDRDTLVDVPDLDAIEADGGEDLTFDFPYDPAVDARLDTNQAAGLTQLFYITNMLHDWTAAHGFDEASGNFQHFNYSRQGRDQDAVRAEAQDASRNNNASFGTPPDGQRPRMQVHLWFGGQGDLLTINSPEALARGYRAGTAAFGPAVGPDPITGELAVARDGSDNPLASCGTVVNPGDVEGRIALINRGECTFEQKVFRAQQAGAIAVIVCNAGSPVSVMGAAGDPNDFNVTIPSIIIPESDCRSLRLAVESGQTVVGTLRDTRVALDGAYDNGIQAHEYGHGISNRLVGGPSDVFCLPATDDSEQMGEGWSDFFALASTPLAVTSTPDGTEPRGIGNFATRRGIGGPGIRRLPYSTDLSVNDFTYDDIIASGTPHPLGEIWATTLWDLYWAMVDDYGFDEDLINGTGGNNLAVRLVIEGMKYTACRPGMLDGRDGILTADRVLTGGANECRIWGVFARRGMGVNAVQGSGDFKQDNREGFRLPDGCIPTVKLRKRALQPAISPGQEVDVVLTVRNDREVTVRNLLIRDHIPTGMRYVDGSFAGGAAGAEVRNDSLIIVLDSVGAGSITELTYLLESAPDLTSTTLYANGAEREEIDFVDFGSEIGTVGWQRINRDPFSGRSAYFAPNRTDEQLHYLRIDTLVPYSGRDAVFRFRARYDTEPTYDGAFLEYRRRNETTWRHLPAGAFIRNNYSTLLAPTTLDVGGVRAFHGSSREQIEGGTISSEGYADFILDLDRLSNRPVELRFVFASDGAVGGTGFFLDDVEFLDLFTYQSSAELITADGSSVTASFPDVGIVVTGEALPPPVSNRTLPNLNDALDVYPNPTDDRATLSFTSATGGAFELRLFDLRGRLLYARDLQFRAGENVTDIDLSTRPAGLYTLQLVGREGTATRKLTVR